MRRTLLGAAFLLSLTGCTPAARPAAAAGAPTPKRVIDLSSTFDAGNGAHIADKSMHAPIYMGMAEITLFDHAGSHYDPPLHMIEGAAAAEQAPLEKLVGPARVLDFRAKPRTAGLIRADFEGKVKPGDFVIAFTGCAPQQPCPYLAKDGAEFLASLPVRAFATDMWTIGNGNRMEEFQKAVQSGTKGTVDDWAPEHYALLSKNIPVVEGLTNLEAILAEPDVMIVALPLKIRGANGAPARVVGLVY